MWCEGCRLSAPDKEGFGWSQYFESGSHWLMGSKGSDELEKFLTLLMVALLTIGMLFPIYMSLECNNRLALSMK